MEQETLESLVRDNRNAGLFRVHRSVFADPRVLDLERRRVFEQCWVYAGHTSTRWCDVMAHCGSSAAGPSSISKRCARTARSASFSKEL